MDRSIPIDYVYGLHPIWIEVFPLSECVWTTPSRPNLTSIGVRLLGEQV